MTRIKELRTYKEERFMPTIYHVLISFNKPYDIELGSKTILDLTLKLVDGCSHKELLEIITNKSLINLPPQDKEGRNLKPYPPSEFEDFKRLLKNTIPIRDRFIEGTLK